MNDENTDTDKRSEIEETIDRTLRADGIVHLIGGSMVEVDGLVERAIEKRELERRTVTCDEETSDDGIPAARIFEDVLVHYSKFGELPSDVQVTAAQHIKGQFEYGTPVIVSSSRERRGDLTLRNGDLVGRVRTIELYDDADEDEA